MSTWQVSGLVILAISPFVLYFWMWSDSHAERCACDTVTLPNEYGTVTVGSTIHGRYICGP